MDDGCDESLPAGPAQSLRSLSVREEAVGKQLLVFQSTVQPEENTSVTPGQSAAHLKVYTTQSITEKCAHYTFVSKTMSINSLSLSERLLFCR